MLDNLSSSTASVNHVVLYTRPVIAVFCGRVIRKFLSFRALFDYDPTNDTGLPGRGLEFKYGHILNVVGDEDSDWWHAVRIMPDDGASGMIPSKYR